MPIELKQSPESNVLEVHVSGKLSADDYDTFKPAVDAMIEKVGRIKILFIMDDFHGWDMGAVWEDIKFAGKHFSDITKIAMVGDKNWEKWMAMICKPFTRSTVKYFDVSEVADARDWVNGVE